LPIGLKFQGTMHLLGCVGYPVSVVLTLLSPAMIMAAGLHHLKVMWPLMVYFQVAFLGTFAYYLTSARALGGGWKRRMLRYPVFLMMFVGMGLNNTQAVIEALVGKRSPFERTPKFNVTSGGAVARGRRYRTRASWSVVGEFVLAGVCLVASVLAVTLKEYAALPFLLMWGGGYGMVIYYSISQGRVASEPVRVLEATLTSPPVEADQQWRGLRRARAKASAGA
jgi:hypothetical protein